jgi:hypothetical protein
MEPHRRTVLVDTLLDEATQKIACLERVSVAHGVSPEARQRIARGLLRGMEQYTVWDEREWWVRIHKGLSEVREALEQIEHIERHRGP